MLHEMVSHNTKKFDFEVFIVTSEPVEKVLPITGKLENSEFRTFATHVLSGASEIGDLKRIGDSIRVSHFPGESVFHLRSRIPALARNCEWIVVLEDHNLVGNILAGARQVCAGSLRPERCQSLSARRPILARPTNGPGRIFSACWGFTGHLRFKHRWSLSCSISR